MFGRGYGVSNQVAKAARTRLSIVIMLVISCLALCLNPRWLLDLPSGPLAFSDSRILALGLGPETFKIQPRRAGFQPSGPGETFVFPWSGRRLQPRVGGPGGGPVLAP